MISITETRGKPLQGSRASLRSRKIEPIFTHIPNTGITLVYIQEIVVKTQQLDSVAQWSERSTGITRLHGRPSCCRLGLLSITHLCNFEQFYILYEIAM